MKKLMFALMMLLSAVAFGQKEYTLESKSSPKTEQALIGKAVKSNDVCTFNGTRYPVYIGSRGGMFIVVKSANGNFAKKYIPKA